MTSISEGVVPHSDPSALRCVTWKDKTNPDPKPKPRALAAPRLQWHLSVTSLSGIVFLVLKFALNIIDHAILFCDLEHVCQQRFLVLRRPKSQRKVTVMSWEQVMLYGCSSVLKCITFVHLPIIAYLLLWR